MTALVRTVVLVAVGMAVLAAGAGAGTLSKAKSTVKITSGNGTDFMIQVSSPKPSCIKSRKVELDREGVKVGSGTTNSSGLADLPGSYTAGNYSSKVKPNKHCKGAKSKPQNY